MNGIPASGKTTLAVGLEVELGFPVVSKDAIKEAHADLVSVQVPTRRLGALSSEAMWSLVGMVNGPVIVDSFWATGRDEEFFQRGVTEAGIDVAVVVWCDVSVGTARRRFEERTRPPIHRDDVRGFEWEQLARAARPISQFPTVIVNAEAPVNVPKLAVELRAVLGLSAQT